MKKFDIKKLLVLILIIAVVAVIIFLVIKGSKATKPSESEATTSETLTMDYFASMTSGYNTLYDGIDVLYNNDSLKYEDLQTANILNVAAKYVSDQDSNAGVSSNIITKLKESTEYGNIDNASIFNGSEIRAAIKTLFGVDFEDQSAIDNIDFKYDIYYNSEFDLYIIQKAANVLEDYASENEKVDYTLIETVKENNDLKTTIAVAYVYNDGTNNSYCKDKDCETIVVENAEEFPKDNINDFEHYTFTSINFTSVSQVFH